MILSHLVPEQLWLHALVDVLDDVDEGMFFFQNQAIKNLQRYFRRFKNIGEAGHKRTRKKCGQRDTMVAHELFKLGLRLQKPRIDVIRQAEELGELAIIDA